MTGTNASNHIVIAIDVDDFSGYKMFENHAKYECIYFTMVCYKFPGEVE